MDQQNRKIFWMYNKYDDDDKLNVAAMYVDKTTCDWFLWWDSTMKGGWLVRDWETFKKKLFKRFQYMEEVKIYIKITRLQQEATMDEYFSNLLVLATCVQDITEEQFLRISIAWIKHNIQSEIKLLDFKYTKSSRQREKLIEEKQKITMLVGLYTTPPKRKWENGR